MSGDPSHNDEADEPDPCPGSPSGLHEPDPTSFAPADGQDRATKEMVVDVNCLHCGRSGSVAIIADEIQW